MKNEESWNTFVRSGKVSDYLNYAGVSGKSNDSWMTGSRSDERERGQHEGASEGYGAVGSYHW